MPEYKGEKKNRAPYDLTKKQIAENLYGHMQHMPPWHASSKCWQQTNMDAGEFQSDVHILAVYIMDEKCAFTPNMRKTAGLSIYLLTISAPNGAKASLANLKYCSPKGMPTIVTQKIRPSIAKIAASQRPIKIIHTALPTLLSERFSLCITSLPNGVRQSFAALKHALPSGMPTTVIQHKSPASAHKSAGVQPKQISQRILPSTDMISPPFTAVCLKMNGVHRIMCLPAATSSVLQKNTVQLSARRFDFFVRTNLWYCIYMITQNNVCVNTILHYIV